MYSFPDKPNSMMGVCLTNLSRRMAACCILLALTACATGVGQDSPQVDVNPSPEINATLDATRDTQSPDEAPATEAAAESVSLPAPSRTIYRHVPRNSYSSVNPEANVIALTFDDGPHQTLTPALLDILKRKNVKATFYVLGSLVQKHPDIARRIVEEGHEIANHSWSHPAFARMSSEAVRRELQRTKDKIVEVTGATPRNYRPPYGSITNAQKQWIYEEFGYPTIMWDVDPLDWRRPGASVVAQRMIDGAKKGSIVLAHDIHPGTIEAVPSAIDGLRARGFEFLTVSELIARDRTAVEVTSTQ